VGRTLTPSPLSSSSMRPFFSRESSTDATFDVDFRSTASTRGTSLSTQERPQSKDGFFAVSASELADMIEKRNLEEFRRLGGLAGIAKDLQTDTLNGLKLDEPYAEDTTGRPSIPGLLDIEAVNSRALQHTREQHFGTNTLPAPKFESFFTKALEALGEPINIALLVCAALEFLEVFLKKKWEASEASEASQSTPSYGSSILMLWTLAVIVLLAAAFEWAKGKEFSRLAKKVCAALSPFLFFLFHVADHFPRAMTA
jgi:hypothetical protein